MIILAMDTSGPVVSAALSWDGRICAEAALDVGLTHSQTMMPLIDRVVSDAGIPITEIDRIACIAGPGSFTGVRIGVAAAKGVAEATAAPCVRVDALMALATNGFGFDGAICPILDARREQVYCAAYRFASGDLPAEMLPPRAMPLRDFLAELPTGRLLFVGDGVPVYGETIKSILGERALLAPAHLRYLRASAACALAPHLPTIPGDQLTPIYLRAPQAVRERIAREEASACRN